MSNRIDITGIDLKQFAKEVYALSQPQGLGFLHLQHGPLSDEDAAAVVARGSERMPLRMDYVNGRACKMTVWCDDGRLTINDSWFDHSDSALAELLRRCGIKTPVHNAS